MDFIESKDLVKNYGVTRALNSFSLKVESGQVTALLGPNGAGKTTFVKALLGLVHYQSGELKVMGRSNRDVSVRQKIAYLPERFTFYGFETVENTLKFFGRCRGLNREEILEQYPKALKKVGIEELALRKIKSLSKGQTQRVGVASLLMGRVEAMILDEPFSGIDPIASKELKDLLLELRRDGMTLFINSHILSEMERISDHIAVVDKGVCLASGPLKDLIKGQSLEDYFYSMIRPQEK